MTADPDLDRPLTSIVDRVGDITKEGQVSLDRVVGAWFALSAAGSRGWGSSATAAATAPTFASGELGAGDFAFPSIVPVYKPPTTLWVRSRVACCS